MLRRSTPTVCLPRVESSSKCVKQGDPIVGRLKPQTNPEISQIPYFQAMSMSTPQQRPQGLNPNATLEGLIWLP